MNVTPWPPLASDPACFNHLLSGILRKSSAEERRYRFVDVWSLDDEALIVQHASAFRAWILAYPTDSPAFEDFIDGYQSIECDHGVYFWRQLLGGMCGTIALLHAIANTVKLSELDCSDDSLLSQLAPQTGNVSHFDSNLCPMLSQRLVESAELRELHESAATASSSRPGEIGKRQGTHFVTFVQHRNALVMLDGRKKSPMVVRNDLCARDGSSGLIGEEGCFSNAAAAEIRTLICKFDNGERRSRACVLALVEEECATP